MPGSNHIAAVISSVGHYLPDNSFLSREVEMRVTAESGGFEMPAGLIERLSGVAHRYYASDGHCSSDLAARAGLKALQKARINPLDIDLLLFAAATHDIAEPATANIVQEKIGCSNAHVFDVKNACNSFLNALDIAHAFIQTRRAQRILITSGEVLSPVINWQVRDIKDLYLKFAGLTLGDGGGACIVEAVGDTGRGILPGRFYSDGSQWRLSTVLSGGNLMKDDTSKMYFECDSAKLHALAAEHVLRLALEILDELGWDLQRDLKLVVPHQVSLKLIKTACEVVQIPLSKFVITLDQVGNTAASSIPIAMSLAVEDGRINRGDKILLAGGAAGFSAAVIPIIW